MLQVDSDLRKDHFHRSFAGHKGNGLSDYLVGDITVEQMIRHTDQDGLDYAARGTAPPSNHKEIKQRALQQVESTGLPVKGSILNTIGYSAGRYYMYECYRYAYELEE